MITFRVTLHATGDRTKDLEDVNQLGENLSAVPGIRFVRRHPHHLGGVGWYYQVFVKAEGEDEGITDSLREVLEDRASLVGENIEVEQLFDLPDYATCRSCGLITEEEQVVCPSCAFRSIDACPHCSVAAAAETYPHEFDDVHRCPSCDRLVELGVNWDGRTQVLGTPWSGDGEEAEVEAVESSQSDEA